MAASLQAAESKAEEREERGKGRSLNFCFA